MRRYKAKFSSPVSIHQMHETFEWGFAGRPQTFKEGLEEGAGNLITESNDQGNGHNGPYGPDPMFFNNCIENNGIERQPYEGAGKYPEKLIPNRGV